MIMKKTYKYLIATLAFSAAALTTGFNLNAQNLKEGTYLEEDGICFRKSATKDANDASKYTIDLEAFVKGKVSYVESADPCDIVLVLDVSGSMDEEFTQNNDYVEASLSHVTYNNQNQTIEAGTYYYKFNDNYYQVHVDRTYYSGRWPNYVYSYQLYFRAGSDWNSPRYYINSQGIVVGQAPTDIRDADANLLNSNVKLYTGGPRTITKMNALKEAVSAFIIEIAKNARFDKKGQKRTTPLDNKIAIVKFASVPDYDINYYDGDTQFEESGDGNHTYYGYNYTEVVRGLKNVLSDSTSLQQAVSSLTAGGATAADYGMKLAKNIIDKIPSTRVSNKTVVFFTDGGPTYSNNEFGDDAGKNAVNYSHEIKVITYGSGEDATHPSVFSVGIFDSTPSPTSTDETLRNIYYFMNYVSSNYPDATSMSATDAGTQASTEFYKDASSGNADLTAIFKSIAGSAASQESNIGSSSAVTVDVVSNSFSIPSNAADAHLEVLVAKCNGVQTIDGKEYFTFAAEQTPEDIGLPPITATINSANNTVSTSGFDFSANFCGPDESGAITTYRGYKQIIRFTITVAEDAVGGPSVATNDETSGIYVNGEQIAEFNRPRVKIPVQIWIQKQGLEDDDSAVFTLYATPYVEGQAEEVYRSEAYKKKWKSFTKVIVNSENMVEVDDPNNPGQKVKVVKLVGLDPNYYYRLKEDAWAFGYQYQTSDGVVDTIGDEIINPIPIVNVPKNLVFDEAVVRNVFEKKESQQK